MTLPLVIAAHGTRDARGLRTVETVAARVATLAPERSVHVGYLDVASPTVGQVFERLTGPCVVVPMLLAPGYHVNVDLPEVAGDAPHPVSIARPVGPDDRLFAVVERRLIEAGWAPPDAVVLGAAGSSSPDSRAVTESVAEQLGRQLGVPVLAAYASAASPTPTEAVAMLRGRGAARVAIATYLLAPGEFADRMTLCGADVVSDPLGNAPEVAEVILERAAPSEP